MSRVPTQSRVQFSWTDQMTGHRRGYYPREEGNRARPCSDGYWSRVESVSRQRLETIQLRRLQRLLAWVEAKSPFYAARWRAAGARPADVRELADLASFPLVTKDELEQDQRAYPPFGTVATVPPHEQMKLWQTSGTTGLPRLWAETKEDWENGMFLYARSLYAHGVRPGWRALVAFGYPPFIGFWLAHYAAEMMGCQVVPKGPLPTQAWLGLLRRLAGSAPAFMCATPTYAQRQLEVAAAAGVPARELGVRILSLAGEPGACVPATKAALETAWGARVHDIMGSTETSGPVLFTCAEQAALTRPSGHVNADYFVVEVLHPETHLPVGEGEAGVACVMPAVRFLHNAYVRLVWTECACGRTLPLLAGGVLARADDMLLIKGVNVYPALLENVIRAVRGLSPEYALSRDGGGIEVQVEALPEVGEQDYAALERRVQEAVSAATTLTLPVSVLGTGRLARSETKSRRLL
jgi:phenylacetate-CoA ligase